MNREESIRRLQTVQTELTTLVPRLTSKPASNIQACIGELAAVIEEIRSNPSVDTVGGYFRQALGPKLSDPQDLASTMPIDSPCGRDCVAAIDAAASLLRHRRQALGEDNDGVRLQVEHLAKEIVLVYVYG